jgi:hypothetical protein
MEEATMEGTAPLSIYDLSSSPEAIYVYDPQPGQWTSTILTGGELVIVWNVDESEGIADIALARACGDLELGEYVGVVTPASLRRATDDEIGEAVVPEEIFHGCCGANAGADTEPEGAEEADDEPWRG